MDTPPLQSLVALEVLQDCASAQNLCNTLVMMTLRQSVAMQSVPRSLYTRCET